ncbi:DUF4157 domain-containing protein [Nocardia xishanensis]|uniref:eCIS core domain-containing protein n=1 Tax=Nocardia xishanensis TaxID=238964 RepID=UPI0033D9295B
MAQILTLQRNAGNRATAELIQNRNTSLSSKVRTIGETSVSDLSTEAVVRGIREATAENGANVSPTFSDLSAAAAGASFSRDASADRSTRLLGADAVAFGNRILFRRDQFRPEAKRGQALIAHELTHLALQRHTGHFLPQRHVSGDVLTTQFTSVMAEAMTDKELAQQMDILRHHLQHQPNDAAVAENLGILESVAYVRQGTAGQPSVLSAPDQQAVAIAGKAIAKMSKTEKLIEAYRRANITEAVRAKLASFITPRVLVAALISFAAAFAVSQLTPVGWAADIALILTAAFIATSLFSAVKHLANFVWLGSDAGTPEELDAAGAEFATAVAEVGVDAVILVVTHGLGGPRDGAVPKGPPPATLRLGVTPEGFVVLVAEKTVPAAVSVGAGIKTSAVPGPLFTRGGGGTKKAGGGRQVSSSGSRPQTGTEVIKSSKEPLRPGKSPLGEYGMDRYGTFRNRPKDRLVGHEMLQNLWLEMKGFGKRLKHPASKDNPAVALSRAEHTRVTTEQRKLGLLDGLTVGKMSAAKNIELNALAMNRAGVPNHVIEVLMAQAHRHAQSLKLLIELR